MLNQFSSLLTGNFNLNNVIGFILRAICNISKTERTPGDARYAKLFVKVNRRKRNIQILIGLCLMNHL